MARTTLLLVEDEPALRKLFQMAVRRKDPERFTFIEAEDGEKALELARSASPHLILLDMILPRLSGREVLEKLKADPATRDIPVVFMSGRDPQGELGAELSSKMAGFLLKPFNALTLGDQLLEILNRLGIS